MQATVQKNIPSSHGKKMFYRYLGNSGLKVSIFSWGNWINTKNDNDITYETVKFAFDNGINFYDTAEIYGYGEGEKSLGDAIQKLKVKREDLVISTKIFKSGAGVNDAFLSRKHIIEGTNNSLKRLQMDYVDILFCHRPDMNTPMEETCRAMDHLIKQGKALYWGTSTWRASEIMHAHLICERLNLVKPIVEQCQYNMIVREEMEKEYVHLFNNFKIGTTVWSPLFSGVLSGKYINEIPKDSRFDAFSHSARLHNAQYTKNKQQIDQKLIQLQKLASSKGFSLAQLALAWVIRNPEVSTCILGASRPSQLVDNLKALDLLEMYTNELEMEVESILDNAPQGEMDWLNFKELPGRRKILFGMGEVQKN